MQSGQQQWRQQHNRAGKDGVELKNQYYCLFILCCCHYNINNKDAEEKLVNVSKGEKKKTMLKIVESIRERKLVLTMCRFREGDIRNTENSFQTILLRVLLSNIGSSFLSIIRINLFFLPFQHLQPFVHQYGGHPYYCSSQEGVRYFKN